MYEFITQEGIKNGSLHHVHILEGDNSKILEKVIFSFKNIGMNTLSNPDFIVEKYTKFSIDDAKELKKRNTEKPVDQNIRKIVLIGIEAITSGAEAPLLKLFEEPIHGVFFFVVVPRVEIFSPTFLSRAILIKNQNDEIKNRKEIKNFLFTPFHERLEFIKQLISEYEKEDNTVMLKKESMQLLNETEKILSNDLKKNFNNQETIEALEYILEMRSLMIDDGFSIKNGLEAFALTMPLFQK